MFGVAGGKEDLAVRFRIHRHPDERVDTVVDVEHVASLFAFAVGGEVFAAHPDDKMFQTGDKILIRRNGGVPLDFDLGKRSEDLELRFINYSMVVCKIEEEE